MYHLIGYCLAGLLGLITEAFTGFFSEFIKSRIIDPVIVQVHQMIFRLLERHWKEKIDQAIYRTLLGMSNSEPLISLGPLGAPGGDPWAYNPAGRITKIITYSGLVVDSVIFLSDHESAGGNDNWSKRFGGNGGIVRDMVCINGPSECLTRIDLTTGSFHSEEVITSITFLTNVKEYGPYGNKDGTSLSIPIEEGNVIVGFNGRASTKFLKAIGVVIKLTP